MRYLSLFSGIEAATVAWEPLGWECVGVAEIEKFPSKLLKQKYPGVDNLGDITQISEIDIIMLGHVDVVVFGSPCQDLSVAGKRAGLAGGRSGLFHDAMRIVRWLRKHCGLRGALWENVPGAFSSNKGADFAIVVGELAGCIAAVPPKGWGNEGAVVGEEAMVEWATLDAQWFGVAQRRRRVFAVADFGDWASRPPILLERESVRGDSAPRRGSGEGVAGTAASCFGGGNTSGPIAAAAAAAALTAHPGGRYDFDSETMVVCATGDVTHTLKADGFDASEDGTGRGTPIVVAHTHLHAIGRIPSAGPQNSDFKPGHEATYCLDSTGSPPAVAYMPHRTMLGDGSVEEGFAERDICDALHCSSGNGNKAPIIAFHHNAQACQLPSAERDTSVSDPLTCSQQAAAAAGPFGVRRLTPLECERLQAFPDRYTAITVAGKPAADGPRYKALGNSMCVNVMRWIGRKIDIAFDPMWG